MALTLIKVGFMARDISRHKKGVLVSNLLSPNSRSTPHPVLTGTEFCILHFSFSSWPPIEGTRETLQSCKRKKGLSLQGFVSASILWI